MSLKYFVPLFLFCQLLHSQAFQYSTLSLDEALTKNADAILRLDEQHVSIEDIDLMRINIRQVVTVLNERGNRSVDAYMHYEKDDKINEIEAVVYNSMGIEVQKFKKKDFDDSSAVSGGTLYSDSRVKYLGYTPVSYPYTIEFVCEFETNNTAFIPQWYFIGDYRTSVEKSRYKVSIKPGIPFKHLEYNFEGYEITSEKSATSLTYQADNLSAIKREYLAPPMRDFVPRVAVGLDQFHLEGVDGRAANWNEFGKWIHDELLTGRDMIDPQTINKVKSLVEGVEDPMEKIDIVYKYVQDNTRYISVQLGIGGWMPISAEEVDRVKYGDCKGLTNYTKALLNAIGIESYYTIVYAGENIRDLDEDFVAMQGNHVILNIPLEGKDAWLECTSQIIPTNFLGSFTDDRKVLRVKPNGGEIIKTPSYPAVENIKRTAATCTLDADGGISGDIVITSKGAQYDDRFYIETMQEEELEKFYKEEWDYVNNVKLAQHEHANNRKDVEFEERLQIEVSGYGTLMENQILFAPNMISRKNKVPKRYRNRTLGFQNQRGYLDEADYTIKLPAGFTLEHPMEDRKIDSEFGTYQLTIVPGDDHTIHYKRSLLLKPWKYPKEAYNDYRNFRKQIARLENSKIILTKS